MQAFPQVGSGPSLNLTVPTSKFVPVAGMRTVVCPIEVIAQFLKTAYANTAALIETCAILAGEEQDG